MRELRKTNEKGITLIALIVTIIVLIILAGITINLLMGDNGILTRAKDAKVIQAKAEDLEKINLLYAEYLYDEAQNNDGKTFLEYLDAQGYIVDYSNENNTEGILVLNGMVYSVDSEGNSTQTGSADKLKPIISNVEATMDGTTMNVTVSIKNAEGAKLNYVLKKESDNSIVQQINNSESLTQSFTGLATDETYIVTVDATNDNGTGNSKQAKGRTESLRGATQGKGSFSINTNEINQDKVIVTINNTYSDSSISIQYKKGTEGTWITYSEPFEANDNGYIYGRYIDLDTQEIGSEFDIEITNIDDIPPQNASIVLSQSAVDAGQTITATVTQLDNERDIAIESCKYIINQSSEAIDVNSTAWNTATAFTSNPETLNITESTRKVDYLHILSVDTAGNKKETVSSMIKFKGSFTYGTFHIPNNYTSLFTASNVNYSGLHENGYLISVSPIDVTSLRSLSISFSGSYGQSYGGDGWQVRFGIGRNSDDLDMDTYERVVGPAKTASSGSATLNVSSLEGDYYIKIRLLTTGTGIEGASINGNFTITAAD